MVKKIITLGIAIIMLFSTASFLACKNEEEGSLDTKLERRIRQDYYAYRGSPRGFSAKNVSLGYVGTYNDWIAAILSLDTGVINTGASFDVTIAGFDFKFSSNSDYFVWKDGQFYDWRDTYDQGFLSQNDIGSIHHRLNNSK